MQVKLFGARLNFVWIKTNLFNNYYHKVYL